ncbi:MAG TPA: oligopeptide:H+ symporter [Caulobacterales bacterium]|nr:oligopeptide:H+ symporter [Caulobacterales bacterium]
MWNLMTAIGLVIMLVTAVPVAWQMRKHPKGMHILFFTEMWERFSYYGMRVILLAYMTQHFLFDDNFGNGTYGAYTSLVFLLPLVGGFLADKLLGTRKAVAFGALLLVAGHLSMAIEQPPAVQTLTYQGQTYEFAAEGRQNQRHTWFVLEGQRYEYGPAEGGLEIKGLPANAPIPSILHACADGQSGACYTMGVAKRDPLYVNIFFAAMGLICMGVGFLKPNISTAIGQLYEPGDPRRDAGFTLYYFGINTGAFWAQVLCAGVGAQYGWGWGFALAGIGMAYGWLVFMTKRFLWFIPGPKQLPDALGLPPAPEQLKKPVLGPINREWLVYILALAGVAIVWQFVQREAVVNTVLAWASAGMLAYFIYYMIRNCTWIESQRLILALFMVACSTVFFSLFELAGSALTQFAERTTQLPSNGFFSITSGQTQSFNGAFVLLLAPAFAALWAWVNKHKLDPGDPAKFALSLTMVGASLLVLVWGANYADADARVPLIFLVLLYFLQSAAELCLSPVGLSAMTKLAPAAVVSTLMATWFLGQSVAQALQAQIAKLTAAATVGGQVLDPHAALATYVKVFSQVGWGGVIIGVTIGVFSPFLKKLAHQGVTEAGRRGDGKKAAPVGS